MTDDFYDLLEVSPDASQEEIKKAFRTQVRVYHPDLNDDDRAQAQFTVLKKAYDVLGDPVERQAYDRLGHEDYVAKRTSGLPSADLWQNGSDGGGSSSTERTTRKTASSQSTSTTGGRSRSSATSSRKTGTSSKRSRTKTAGSSRTAGSANASATSGAGAKNGGGTRTSGAAAGTSGASAGSTGTAAGATGGPADHSTTRRASQSSRSSFESFVRWWHSKNFAWPLIWLSALTYLLGIVHFGLENATALRGVGVELAAVATDPAAAWTTMTDHRHGVDEPAGFVSAFELVTPPLAQLQWYAVLAGIVVVSLLLVLGARIAWRRDTWGPITFDETIVVGLALGATTVVVGGPLLAGIALMPLLFGVIVYRTRQLPGWSPSYRYVLAVCAPGVALAAGVAGYASLPSDFVAFVVLPILGAFGLPLRVQVRKRFGR